MRRLLMLGTALGMLAGTAAAAHIVAFKSPGPGMHFTEGRPIVVFADLDPSTWGSIVCPNGEALIKPPAGGPASCSGGSAPVAWPQVQVLVDGVLQADANTGNTTVTIGTDVDPNGNPPVAVIGFRLPGLPAGARQLMLRGRFSASDVQDGAPITVIVDPEPSGKGEVTSPTGSVNWTNVIVRGSGQTLTVSGNVVIRDSLILGFSGITGSVGSVDIQNSVFEDTGRLDLTASGAVTVANNEFRANNRLTFVPSDPSVPAMITIHGNGAGQKLFQGNRIGAGQMRFTGSNWLIGGDTDPLGNVFMGPRCVLNVSATNTRIVGNYAHHNYRGGWSQGFNFDYSGAGSGVVTEHNFIRDGSWPVQSLTGDFRYNVVYGYGHTWVRSASNGTAIHHNLFLPDGGGGFEPGRGRLWFYGGGTGLKIYNNTMDGGGLTGDFEGAFVRPDSPSQISSLRNNLFTYARDMENGSTGEPFIAGLVASADYNAFYSPDSSNLTNYALNPPVPGAGADDVGGPNGRLSQAPFAGSRVFPLESLVNEDAVWNRTQTLSSILAVFRVRYTPKTASPVKDAGDPADTKSGQRIDIGAIEAPDGEPHPDDCLGKFGAACPPVGPPDTLAPARPRGLRKR